MSTDAQITSHLRLYYFLPDAAIQENDIDHS